MPRQKGIWVFQISLSLSLSLSLCNLRCRYNDSLSSLGSFRTRDYFRYNDCIQYFLVHIIYFVCLWQIWPPGSLEEKVQHLVKTWEMEMFHKVCFDEYKTLDPKKYRFSLNGNKTTNLFTLLSWLVNFLKAILIAKVKGRYCSDKKYHVH